MNQSPHFAVLAIPLGSPASVNFLLPSRAEPRGAAVTVVGQRPSLAAQAQWRQHLARQPRPTAADLLWIDDPHTHLRQTTTDRLVPAQFLREPNFLTRDLGGWVALYFGVFRLPRPWPADPLLAQARVLADYGPRIRFYGADAAQVAARLPAEIGLEAAETAAALRRLWAERPSDPTPAAIMAYLARLYAEVATGRRFGTPTAAPVPRPLLLDELLDWHVRLELRRRAADAAGDEATAAAIGAWQQAQRAAHGLIFILKGEYVVGRHRRSTVLIAPELGVVVKQPGPEPFHEIAMGAVRENGRGENWPAPTHDESLVTPRGRIRQVLAEGLIPRLHQVLRHPLTLYTLLGLTIEPFVDGPTTQALVLGDPAALTPELYETYVLHQQVGEALGVENGDWHAANFVVRRGDGAIVHIDWGAARPLRAAELTPAGRLARLNQVQNIAFSFHDAALAARATQLHAELLADEARLARLQARARELVAGSGVLPPP